MSEKKKLPDVYIWAFPAFVVCWPFIVVGYLLPVLMGIGLLSEQVGAIMWLTTLVFIMMAMGLDFDREGTVYLLGTSFITFLLGVIITIWLQIPVLKDILEFIGVLRFRISADSMLMLSLALSIVYGGMIVYVYFCNRWRVSPGIMERIVWWKIEEEIPLNTSHPLKAVFLDHFDRIILFNGGHLRIKVDGEGEKTIGLVWGDISALEAQLDEYETIPVSSH